MSAGVAPGEGTGARASSSAFVRFLLVGAANTGLTWAVYLALVPVLPYLAAYSAAYVLGIVIGYLLNAAFVFRVPLSWRGLAAMPLVYVAQFVIGSAVLWLVVEEGRIDRRVALAVSLAVSVPLTFLLSRVLVGGTGVRPSPIPLPDLARVPTESDRLWIDETP